MMSFRPGSGSTEIEEICPKMHISEVGLKPEWVTSETML